MMIKRLKRVGLRTLWTIGGFKVLKPIRSDCPRVIMYHRFSATRSQFKLSQKSFEKQVIFLTNRFYVVDLASVVSWVKGKGKVQKNCVAITIDDGHKDFYLHAYPILKSMVCPLQFFLQQILLKKGTGSGQIELPIFLRILRERPFILN